MTHDNSQSWWQQTPTSCQKINMMGVDVVVKRDDLNHPIIQGNKLRKLKYNVLAAKQQQAQTLVTFGGAYSNHLLATAFAAKSSGLKAVGVVRGDELADQPAVWSETLFQCQQLGMDLKFINRAAYRIKQKSSDFQALLSTYDACYVIPEGGSNQLALEGVAELVSELKQQLSSPPSHIICPVGTGGTVAGLIKGVVDQDWRCKLIGVVVLKGLRSINDDIKQWLEPFEKLPNYELRHEFHAGGYAKNTVELVGFCNAFEQNHQITLDKIYNSKSFYALAQLIQSGEISASDRPVIIHTGGLQGGVNQ